MSRPTASTRRRSPRCARCSAGTRQTGGRSSSPAICWRRSSRPARTWSSCTRARSWRPVRSTTSSATRRASSSSVRCGQGRGRTRQAHRGPVGNPERRPRPRRRHRRQPARRCGGGAGQRRRRRRPGGAAAAPGGCVPRPGGRRHESERGTMTTITQTFSYATEFRRQATRRRTQLALGFMVLLPLIILAAFQLGGGDSDNGGRRGQFSSLVDLATAGGVNFALFTIFVSASFLLIVVVALFCGDTVASEASWGSLRYLLAIPVPRGRLLGVKLLVSLLYSLLALVALTGTALAAGTLRYGWHPLRSTIAGEIAAGDALLRLLGIVGYLSVSLLVVAGLAFLLSVMTDAPLGAVGGAVLLQILSSILDQITALGAIRSFLPTHFSDAWLGLLSNPTQTDDLVRGCVAALAYAVVFFALAWWRFLRKDVVS